MTSHLTFALKGLLLSTTMVSVLFVNACADGVVLEGYACDTTADCRGELECMGSSSTLDGQARCQCPDFSEHDGGDGTCVDIGLCVAEYHDGGDGSCVPNDQCVDGVELSAEGTCLPPQQVQSEECAKYIECHGHYADETDTSATNLYDYGPEGSCWSSGPEAADACTMACDVAITSLADALSSSALELGPCG